MNPSPIPAGTISTGVSAAALLAAALGAFQGHPGWLCLALGIVAAVAIARGAIEAWKAKGAAVLALLLLAPGCATFAPGHYVAIPPDPAACAAAGLAVYEAQKPCDVSPRPPVSQIIECAVAAILAARPCAPATTWVPDPPAAPAPVGK